MVCLREGERRDVSLLLLRGLLWGAVSFYVCLKNTQLTYPILKSRVVGIHLTLESELCHSVMPQACPTPPGPRASLAGQTLTSHPNPHKLEIINCLWAGGAHGRQPEMLLWPKSGKKTPGKQKSWRSMSRSHQKVPRAPLAKHPAQYHWPTEMGQAGWAP